MAAAADVSLPPWRTMADAHYGDEPRSDKGKGKLVHDSDDNDEGKGPKQLTGSGQPRQPWPVTALPVISEEVCSGDELLPQPTAAEREQIRAQRQARRRTRRGSRGSLPRKDGDVMLEMQPLGAGQDLEGEARGWWWKVKRCLRACCRCCRRWI
ncbi:hypothetical protein GQ602_005985 [Ophiocordyceps camponoti-floridani]|uniref:Uncharacterized protein n=1 Tax=Ophiocordyceps camponoti-floridani TaxID=2030778 RepID=A0A8H4Q2C2_9HYPO|nr:hypothetical protein GQ602_005985 [Ophiocordyceps camponoti-floridani]